MSVTPAYFLSLSLEYLKQMLGDSEVWRAVVAEPNADWDTLATLIAAESSPEAPALAKIKAGRFEEHPEHENYVKRPRICVRHLDEYDAERVSSTGYDLNGSLITTFEIPVPSVHLVNDRLRNFEDAYIDAMNKVGGVIKNLSELPDQAGYLQLTNLGMGPTGLFDPKEVDPRQQDLVFFVSDWLIQFMGGP